MFSDNYPILLMLKLQYFGHLMQSTNSLEKTLMLGKIEGRRRKRRQRMRWLDDITNSTDMSLSKLWEIDRDTVLQSMGLERVRHDLATEQQQSAICLSFQPILHLLSPTHVCILTIRSNYSPPLNVLVPPFKMSQSLAWLLLSLACSHFSKGIFVEFLLVSQSLLPSQHLL